MDNEVVDLDWSNDRMVPAFQAVQHLDIYDIRGASRNGQLTITALAGLINRPQPQIYLLTGDDDVFWQSQLLRTVPQSLAPASGDAVLERLITFYRPDIQGLIIYDPTLVDTINIATMMAGQRDGIVVSPEQVQSLQDQYDLPILVDLRTFQWRNRLEIYLWALQHLLRGCSTRLVAGMDPTIITGLRSFLVATRSFIYWLDSRQFLPSPGDGWLSERSLMQSILEAFSAHAVHFGWFIDEGSGVNLASEAALPVLASDFFINLEVWTALQPSSFTIPEPRPVEANAPQAGKIYVSFTMSDGDNLQYCQHRLAQLWRDNARGRVPIGWTFSPALMEAAPAMANYYLSGLSPNDELIAGPSGAGYIFPSRWPSTQLSSFLQRTGRLMQATGMTTLEVLDTDFLHRAGLPWISTISLTGMAFRDRERQQSFVQELAPWGLGGILSGAGTLAVSWEGAGLPIYHNLGLAGSVEHTLTLLKILSTFYRARPLFLNVYVLAWSMTPGDLLQVVQRLGSDYEFVLPSALLAMLARS